ncbi:MAG: IMP dehydrogenase [Candidatus Bipolaricaulia bacterium]
MIEDKLVGVGLTFDDVLLIPQRSGILPRDVDVHTRLTPRIDLNIPIISAAMDTVTESQMAIAIARDGGVGVVHRNLSPERQAEEVQAVKRYESGIIRDPITLTQEESVGQALQVMERFDISGIPIVSDGGRLEGLITIRDLRFQQDLSRKIAEVMTRRKALVTAPMEVSFDKAKKILHDHKIEKLPLVDEDFRLRGLITIKDIQKAEQHPNACKDTHGRLRVGAAVGTSLDLEREERLIEAGVDFLVVDTAHGDSDGVIDKIQGLKRAFQIDVIAGNVATPAGAAALAKAGADAIKVGVGPGSICTSRIVAGVGVPQLTAIYNCAQIAKEYGLPTIADGGIRFSGDIAKAIVAGADVVMIGALLSGTKEAPGEVFTLQGKLYKTYRGMGSLAAMRAGSADRYGRDQDDLEEPIPEGIEGRVRYRGELNGVLRQLVGGLQASMGYCGTPTIEALQRDGQFIQVTHAGVIESHPHDIQITKEAPNYSLSDLNLLD